MTRRRGSGGRQGRRDGGRVGGLRHAVVDGGACVLWATAPDLMGQGCMLFAALVAEVAAEHLGAQYRLVAGGFRRPGFRVRGRSASDMAAGRFHTFLARRHPGGVEVADATAVLWQPPTLVWGWREEVAAAHPDCNWSPAPVATEWVRRWHARAKGGPELAQLAAAVAYYLDNGEEATLALVERLTGGRQYGRECLRPRLRPSAARFAEVT